MITISSIKAFALTFQLRRLGFIFGPQVFAAVLFAFPLLAQQAKPVVKAAATQPGVKAVESPMKISGIRYVSANRRDPFLNPILIKKNAKPSDEEIPRGAPPAGIAGTYIEQAILQGTSVRADRKMAIVRGADTRAYFLKEGDRLFDGYLKAIGNDFITLVREIRMRSGKTITQEVTKRLRTP